MQTCLLLLSLFIFAIFVAKRHAKKVFFYEKGRKIIANIFL